MSQVSNFKFDEIISPAELRTASDVLKVTVPAEMQERRIYLFVEVKVSVSPGAFLFEGEVNLRFRGQQRGKYPAAISDQSTGTWNKSVASLFNSGGGPVGDSIGLRLAQPFKETFVVLQPLRVNAQADLATFSILQYHGVVTGFRAYLAVLSTRY